MEALSKSHLIMIFHWEAGAFSCRMGLSKHEPNRKAPPTMKTVTEILGGAQTLMGISFNLQDSFEEHLTD